MVIHDLKVWPEYYEALREWKKTFEVRDEKDRHFNVGDVLALKCWDPDQKAYMDVPSMDFEVTYCLREPFAKDGTVIMGIKYLPEC